MAPPLKLLHVALLRKKNQKDDFPIQNSKPRENLKGWNFCFSSDDLVVVVVFDRLKGSGSIVSNFSEDF